LTYTLTDSLTHTHIRIDSLKQDCEVTVTPLTPACSFIVLGSDGLWDVLSSQQVVDYVFELVVGETRVEDVGE